jgi:hypothetical protein
MHPEIKQGTTIKEVVFSDPLTEVTRKVRRNLLVASAFAILLKVYNLKVTKLPWLEIDIPENGPQILEGILAVSVAYLFVTFLIYVTQDLNRWKVGGHVLVTKGNWDLILNTRNDIHVIKQHIKNFDPEKPKPEKYEQIEKAVNEALERLPKSEAQLTYVENQYSRLTVVQWIRLSAIELGVPLVLGSYALFKVGAAIGPLLKTAVTNI